MRVTEAGMVMLSREIQPPNAFQPIEVTEPDYRTELRNYINEHSLDGKAITIACGLNNNSTNEDFKKALDFAKNNKTVGGI